MKTIGIIGGMGPLATADLYTKIINFTVAEKDQDHMHVMIDSNPKIPDRTEYILHGGESPLPEIVKSIRRLEAAGSEFLIMPCNTAHHIIKEIEATTKIPFINMMEETVKIVAQEYPGQKVGLLATDGTAKSGAYHKYFEPLDIEVVIPQKHQKDVMDYIYQGIKTGDLEKDISGVKMAVEEMEAMGATIFILGCTELSAVSEKIRQIEKTFLDPLEILAVRSIQEAGRQAKELRK
jgi:aspartate racemase